MVIMNPTTQCNYLGFFENSLQSKVLCRKVGKYSIFNNGDFVLSICNFLEITNTSTK